MKLNAISMRYRVKDRNNKVIKFTQKIRFIETRCRCCKKEVTFAFPTVNLCPHCGKVNVLCLQNGGKLNLGRWTIEDTFKPLEMNKNE